MKIVTVKLKSKVKELVRSLIHELSGGNYSIVRKPPFHSSEDISKAIKEYGETIIDLPDGILDEIEAVCIKGEKSKYTFDIDLWTEEQGESDLTLSLTVSEGKTLTIEIDSLHIL